MLNRLIKESTLLKRVGIVKSISSLIDRSKDIAFGYIDIDDSDLITLTDRSKDVAL